jgi:hypothetical protein
MLFIHETHRVDGRQEDEFEAAFREGWMPTLAKSDDARLLWYTNHAHGSGMSYNVVTITGVRDAAAWERLALRVQRGDLQDWARALDQLRHDVKGKTLVPVHWSPLQEVDLASVPTDGAEHEPSLFMEDTGWPYSSLDEYIQCWYDIYFEPMQRVPADLAMLDIQACFQVAHGSYQRREAMLWQKIYSAERLVGLLSRDFPPEHRQPGSYMYDALAYRDQWESRLLRTSTWSPLY